MSETIDKAFNPHQPRAKNGQFASATGTARAGETGQSREYTAGHPVTASVRGASMHSWDGPRGGDYSTIPDKPGVDKTPLSVPEKKRAAAGVIIHEPDGRVWLTKPTNAYGGYQHTFPKGGQEEGLTLQQTAIKEAHEETGLHVEITGHAGDYERDTSVARYYHARRIGGTPRDAHWESEAVVLAHPADMHSLLNRRVDQQIAHEHAGAPKPPAPKEPNAGKHDHETWYQNFGNAQGKGGWSMFTPKVKKGGSFAEHVAAIRKGFDKGQPRDKDGKWTSGGGGSWSHSVSTDKWQSSHAPVLAAKKWLDTVNSTVNHPTMSTAEKAMALAQMKLPAGGNTFQKAKLKAHAEAVQHLSDMAMKEHEASPKAPSAVGGDKESGGSSPIDVSKWKKIENQKGSNPGGVYEDSAGGKHYVKHLSEDHAKSEVLAGHLYSALGVENLKPQLVKHDGGHGVATPWAENIKTIGAIGGVSKLSAARKDSAQQNFAAHALLGNWDAAGLGHDNQGFIGDHHHAVTLDGGGSLEYRAQGQKKGSAWNDKADEWDTMRDPKINKDAADLFGSMTSDQLHASAHQLHKLTDDKITSLVAEHGPGDAAHKAALAKTLIAHKAAIIAKADALHPATASAGNAEKGKSMIAQLHDTPVSHPYHAKIKSLVSTADATASGANKAKAIGNDVYAKYKTDKAAALYAQAYLLYNQHGSDEPSAKVPEKVAQTKQPPALPAKLTEADFPNAGTGPLNIHVANKIDAIHMAGEDYKSGKITADEAKFIINHEKASTQENKFYTDKVKNFADSTKAAITAHAGSGASEPIHTAPEAPAPKPTSAAHDHTAKAKAPEKKPFDPSKISEPLDFNNWSGQGKPLSSVPAKNEANTQGTHLLYEAAKTGSADAVKSVKLPVVGADGALKPDATTYDKHPSKHVKDYGEQMLAEIDSQHNPAQVYHPPPGSVSEQFAASFPVKAGGKLANSGDGHTRFILLGTAGSHISTEDVVGDHPKLSRATGLTGTTYKAVGDKAYAHASKAQKEALAKYTSNGYTGQNSSYLAGNPTGAAKLANEAIQTHGHGIKPGTVLSRRVNLGAKDIETLAASTGHVLQDPAIVSSSTNPDVFKNGRNTHFKLTVGPGVKGFYIGKNSSVSTEGEMLLPANTRLLVTKYEKTTATDEDGFGGGDAKHIVHAVILPNHEDYKP